MRIFRNSKFHIFPIFLLVLVALLSVMVSLSYVSLHTGMMDLGIFLFHLENIGLGDWEWMFFGHIQPFHLLFFFIHSKLDSNIASQALLIMQLMLIIFPAYFIKREYGMVVALAYLLYFPLWFNIFFDFHLDHLSICFLSLFFLSLRSNSFGLATISAILLALVKEIFALQTAMCGIYLIGYALKLKYELKNCLYGLGLIFFGFGYFYFATEYVVPLYLGDGAISSIKSEPFFYLGSNIGEVLRYIFNQPFDILMDIFSTPGKIIYLVALFGALGFIPLLKPGPLIVALPILAISLLSQHEGYYGLGHHYTAGLIAPMIFAFAGGLPQAKLIWHRSVLAFHRVTRLSLPVNWFIPLLIAGLLSAHIALAPSPIGRLFWSDKVWTYSYKAYIPTERDAMIKRVISDFIPTDPSVVVSIQNTVNWLPLVQRQHFLLFPEGVTKMKKVPFFEKKLWPPKVKWKGVMAEYVVLDLKRPWFLVDKGCDWLYGKCTNDRLANEYLKWVEKTRNIMQVVFEKDDFVIFRRPKLELEDESNT